MLPSKRFPLTDDREKVEIDCMGQKPVKTDGSTPLQGRQETFCQVHADGKVSTAEAYRRAGYSETDANSASHRLYTKVHIQARIACIQAERAKEANITRETLADDYNRALRIAEAQDNAAGMCAATTGKARLYGFDRQVVEQTTPEPMTRSEAQEADEFARFQLWQARQARAKVLPMQGESGAKAG